MLVLLLTRFLLVIFRRWLNGAAPVGLVGRRCSSFVYSFRFGSFALVRGVSDARTVQCFQRFFRLLLGWPICWKLPSHDGGGDIWWVSRLGAEIRDHSECFASVVIERLTGWPVLPVITICFGDPAESCDEPSRSRCSTWCVGDIIALLF